MAMEKKKTSSPKRNVTQTIKLEPAAVKSTFERSKSSAVIHRRNDF